MSDSDSSFNPAARRVVLLLTGALIVAVLAYIQTGFTDPNGENTPVVSFERAEVHLGSLLQRERIHHDLRLMNRGTNSVRVVALRGTCACTVLPEGVLGEAVPPGGSITVPVIFETGTSDGTTVSSVTVRLVDGEQQHVARAVLRASVVADFTVNPRTVDFGVLRPGESASRNITVSPQALQELVVGAAQVSQEVFQVAQTKDKAGHTSLNSSSADITVRFAAPATARRQAFSDVIRISTSSDRMPTVRIPVRAQVIPEVEISPDTLVLVTEGTDRSRFTISTSSPSQIIRLVAKTGEGLDDISLPALLEREAEDWATTHRLTVPNALLLQASRLDIELNIRNQAERPEARAASVEIKRLQ